MSLLHRSEFGMPSAGNSYVFCFGKRLRTRPDFFLMGLLLAAFFSELALAESGENKDSLLFGDFFELVVLF